MKIVNLVPIIRDRGLAMTDRLTLPSCSIVHGTEILEARTGVLET